MEFDIIVKWFIAVTGLLTVIIKFADTFSVLQRKRNLKADLELLEKIGKDNLETQDVEKINLESKRILDEYLTIRDKPFKLFDIFYALILFLGFGWWTIFIYQLNNNFSPWTILTGLISFIGLSLLLDGKWRKGRKEKTLLTIVITHGLGTGITLSGLSIVIGFFIFSKYDGYTNWYLLIGIMFPIGLKIISDCINFKR